jgi:hypothetical protein
MRATVPRVVNAPTSIALNQLLLISSFVSEGASLPQCPDTHFPVQCKSRLFALRSPALWSAILLLLRCPHSFRPRFLMPLLHSSCARCLFPNVYPFEVSLATLSLVWFFCRLCLTVGLVWLSPVCRATAAWRVIPLQAAAKFFQDSPSPWVHFCSCWRHPMARCHSPYCFFSALTVHCGLLFRDFWMLHYGLHFFWIYLQLLRIGLRLLSPGLHLL